MWKSSYPDSMMGCPIVRLGARGCNVSMSYVPMKTKTRFPGQGKRGIAHERGGWVAGCF
jgi:hypothetical protein